MFKIYSGNQIKVLIGSLLMMAAFGMVNSSVGYFVVPVTRDLGFSRAEFTLYYTIMNLVGIAVTPLIGQLLMKVAPKWIILAGGVWGAACIAGFSMCKQLWTFYFIGLLFGLVQSGCTMMTVATVINRWFGNKSGTPTGIAMAGTGISGILQGFAMPAILNHLGWRGGYVCQAGCWLAAMLLAAVLAGRKLPAYQETSVSLTQKETLTADPSGVKLSQALQSTTLYFLMLGIFLLSAPGCFLQHMPAYYAEQGCPDATAGMIMSVFSLFVIIFKVIQGYMFDHWGAVRTTLIAVLLYAFGFWISIGRMVPTLFLSAVLLAFGLASLTILPPLLTKTIFGNREYAAIYSIVSAAYTCGNAAGAPIWGAVHDATGTYFLGVVSTPVLLLLDLIVLLSIIIRSRKRPTYTEHTDVRA